MNEKLGVRKFLILCCVVFFGFSTIGLPLAVLPFQIHDLLGFSAFIVGVVIGLQSFATVLTRQLGGSSADLKGGKPTVQRGLMICFSASAIYLVSTFFLSTPLISIGLLSAGRLVLGLGESFLITGALMWGIGLIGHQNSGKVMAWNGIAMYGALALGAPVGLWLYSHTHIQGVMLGTMLCPTIGFLFTLLIPAVKAENIIDEREPFMKIFAKIWAYGAAMGMGTIGFGALSIFIVLFFRKEGFGDAGTAMLIFGAFYILVRLVAGHLPDKAGGGVIAIISLFVEALGQALIWLAPNAPVAYAGAALTGAGFSLVFPSLGIQATKSVPAHSRGSALGAFFAFFDLALGITAPLCGAIATSVSYPTVYLFGMCACFLGSAGAFVLWQKA